MKVALIFGGVSDEHEVSLASAQSVMRALNELPNISCCLVGIDKCGRWLYGEDVWRFLMHQSDRKLLPRGLSEKFDDEANLDGWKIACDISPPKLLGEVDVIFPLILGKNGEDGTMQALANIFDKPLMGCNILSSAVGFDKTFAKNVLKANAIDVVEGECISYLEYINNPEKIVDLVSKITDGFPVFVKPNASGSSWGIRKANTFEELRDAVEMALRYDERVIIERYVSHREIVVGVVESSDQIFVSELGECAAEGELYTYHEKYLLGNLNFRCPAPVSELVRNEIQYAAKRIFSLLRCQDFARIDFFIEKSTGRIFFNEINTIPGLTDSSVFPKVMNATGVGMASVLEMCLANSLKRKEADRRRKTIKLVEEMG